MQTIAGRSLRALVACSIAAITIGACSLGSVGRRAKNKIVGRALGHAGVWRRL